MLISVAGFFNKESGNGIAKIVYIYATQICVIDDFFVSNKVSYCEHLLLGTQLFLWWYAPTASRAYNDIERGNN